MAVYRAEASSIEGFVQQIAASYFRYGYTFHVVGRIPAGKDPAEVDRKLIAKYDIALSKAERARRKRSGQSCCHYVRHDDFFAILATKGYGRFFEEETPKDARKSPIRYAGYSVSFRGGHGHVRIEDEQYKTLKAYLLEEATRRDAGQMAAMFRSLPFRPYSPVRGQLITLLRFVNRARKAAGKREVPLDCLTLRMKPVKVFEKERTQGSYPPDAFVESGSSSALDAVQPAEEPRAGYDESEGK